MPGRRLVASVLTTRTLLRWKQVERLIYDDPNPESGFLLNVDSKWSTHPDCATVPRDQWLGHASVKRLYCLGIVHRRGSTGREARPPPAALS